MNPLDDLARTDIDPALPALAELRAWLLATQRTVAAGSGTAKAIDHALKRWPALERYANSGILPIDNNPVSAAQWNAPTSSGIAGDDVRAHDNQSRRPARP